MSLLLDQTINFENPSLIIWKKCTNFVDNAKFTTFQMHEILRSCQQQMLSWFLYYTNVWIVRHVKLSDKIFLYPLKLTTLKSLIEEHACLYFSDFLSTLLAIFHVINKKFHPARLLTCLVKKQAGWNFFATLHVYSGLLFY